MSFQISPEKAVDVPTQVVSILATATTEPDVILSVPPSPMPPTVEERCPSGGAQRATQEWHLELHI